ncbi:hypothetical protein CK203_056929 [Vitis vinifera]|uniref:Uncharacterized protein n=1 Tax=Vitis vinifera TaxID=29760 RepID=A0A438FUL5_VITVI|nr:hypothetical protein CK203_056929 [Vitis vinifera]
MWLKFQRGWDEPNAKEVGRMKSQPNAPNAKVGMYTLNEDIDMKAKVAAMARRLEELEMKRYKKCRPFLKHQCKLCRVLFVNILSTCPITKLHMATLTIQIGRTIQFLLEAKGTSVHATWKAPPQALNLEQAIVNLNQIDNLQYSISRLTNLNTVQEKEKFPSQPHQNPKEVDLPTPKPEHEPESEAEKEKRKEIKGKRKGSNAKNEDLESTVNEEPRGPPPFPQALDGKKGINNASKILEVLGK